MEPFVDCHSFQFTRKSSDVVFIAEFNPEYNSLVFVICQDSGLCHWCSSGSSSFVTVPGQPQCSCVHLLGTSGVFFPAGGTEPSRGFTLSLSSGFLCDLSLEGRPDHYFCLPARNSPCVTSELCDRQRSSEIVFTPRFVRGYVGSTDCVSAA